MKIPYFNPHSNCQGHSAWFLDHEYEDAESRKLLSEVISRYVEEENKD